MLILGSNELVFGLGEPGVSGLLLQEGRTAPCDWKTPAACDLLAMPDRHLRMGAGCNIGHTCMKCMPSQATDIDENATRRTHQCNDIV